jgi:hypothetical protein
LKAEKKSNLVASVNSAIEASVAQTPEWPATIALRSFSWHWLYGRRHDPVLHGRCRNLRTVFMKDAE